MLAAASFPTNIIIDILSKLPIKSLFRFASAGESWVPLIEDVFNRRILSGTNTRILIWPLLPKKLYEHVFLRSLNPETLLRKEGDNIYEEATTCLSLPTTENLKNWYLLTSPTENLDNLTSQKCCVLHIIGSSLGLICYSIDKGCVSNPTIVWNPLTGRHKKIPPCRFILRAPLGQGAMYLSDDIDEYQVWGFGYNVCCPDDGDYKVLARVRSGSSQTRQFQVYSLQANTWRVLSSRRVFPNYILETSHYCEFLTCMLETCHRSAQTPLNGVLHWLITNTTEVEPEGLNNTVINGIVAFDLSEEKFSEFPLPDCIAVMNRNVPKFLAILDGRLCAYYRDIYDDSKTEIWVMKEYGIKESWAPWISVANVRKFQPIYMLQNKEILALIDDGKDHDLVSYNPTHKTYKVIKSLWFGRFCGVVYEEGIAPASLIGHSELTAEVPRHPQPTSCNPFVTKGPKTHQVITENDVALHAKFDLPGVDADEVAVRVDLDNYIIHIVANEGGKDPEFDMGEGKETRKYNLGIRVDPYGLIEEKVKWSLRNGVLKLVVAKREGAGGVIRARQTD